MADSSSTSLGPTIAGAYTPMAGYAQMLVADVPAERFCEMPHPTMNHPAFVFGHLAIYPKKIAEMLGNPEAVAPVPEGWADVFEAGIPCDSDPSKYPSKDRITAYYHEAYDAAAAVIAATPDDRFLVENPHEGMRERFPTLAIMTNFMLNSHVTMHLGQVSAWRRAVGLGSVL